MNFYEVDVSSFILNEKNRIACKKDSCKRVE